MSDEEEVNQPRTLELLCAVKILQTMGEFRLDHIEQLPVPRIVKDEIANSWTGLAERPYFLRDEDDDDAFDFRGKRLTVNQYLYIQEEYDDDAFPHWFYEGVHVDNDVKLFVNCDPPGPYWLCDECARTFKIKHQEGGAYGSTHHLSFAEVKPFLQDASNYCQNCKFQPLFKFLRIRNAEQDPWDVRNYGCEAPTCDCVRTPGSDCY